jgi:predicted acetyltransferase
MTTIDLERCGPGHRATLDALFQLYTHDFSEYWAGQPRGEVDEAGRFPDYPGLDRFWTEPGREAFLIRVDGHIAGFVLVSEEAHSGVPADHDMTEFFVMRKHRGAGVGMDVALKVISERPGAWEIAVTRANVQALAFWKRVAEAVSPRWEEHDVNDDRWNGAILRLQVV